MFTALRASILYVRAAQALQQKDIGRARASIEEAKELLGKKLVDKNLFDIYLRAAIIYLSSEEKDRARANVIGAIAAIDRHKHLSSLDKNYLLDYCDHFLSDINGSSASLTYRVHHDEFDLVKPRIRRDYPLVWLESNA
jgi:hypothetical protein